jgi:hypothetical protein
MERLFIRLALALAALLTVGCASVGAGVDPPREYLDESTAATVTVANAPLVFARERTELAANARDYVTLATAAVDRTGKIGYVLVCYRWSTVDARLDQEPPSDWDTIVLQADDRRITFSSPSRSARDAGIGTPVHPPPGPTQSQSVYRTDLATLRFIAAARHLRLELGTGDRAAVYDVWSDGRAALGAFVDVLSGPH